VYSNPANLLFVERWWMALLFVEIGLVFTISLAINKIGALPALGLLFVYALINGLVLGVIVWAYVSAGAVSAVVSAFAGASAVFGGAALYGAVTRRDLTSLGGILFMGLFGLIVAWFVQIFFLSTNSAFAMILSGIGVLIFTGLTAYDVQRIKEGRMP